MKPESRCLWRIFQQGNHLILLWTVPKSWFPNVSFHNKYTIFKIGANYSCPFQSISRAIYRARSFIKDACFIKIAYIPVPNPCYQSFHWLSIQPCERNPQQKQILLLAFNKIVCFPWKRRKLSAEWSAEPNELRAGRYILFFDAGLDIIRQVFQFNPMLKSFLVKLIFWR